MRKQSFVRKKNARRTHTNRQSALRRFFTRSPRRIAGAVISLAAVLVVTIGPGVTAGDQSPNLESWWPVEGANATGLQPFKAIMKDRPVDTYEMFWQVDGGQRNPMQNSDQDYPHKEAQVDLTNWNWNDAGQYKVTFVAVDQQGQTIGERTVTVQKDGLTPPTSSSDASSSSSSSFDASSTSSSSYSDTLQVVTDNSSSVSSMQDVVVPLASSMSSPSSSSSSSDQPSAPATLSMEVWWPIQNATVQGTQPFKAVVPNWDMKGYDISWSVDDGQLNAMKDNFNDAPHKEAQVDVSGWKWRGSGPYTLTFRATDGRKRILATKTVTIFNGAPDAPPVASVSSSSVVGAQPLPSSSSLPAVVVRGSTNNVFAGAKLYVNQNSDAKRQAEQWRQQGRAADAAKMDKIAQQPETFWFGNWNSDLSRDVTNAIGAAKNQGALPVLVAYNIPQRDCGGYSAGGSGSPDAYRNWIRTMANAIGNDKAAVLLEPDALAGMTCLSQQDQSTRLSLLREAVQTLKSQGNVAVYLDAGHSGWVSEDAIGWRLKQAGIDQADGFALNVSNFMTDDSNRTYGEKISQAVGGKHFVVDTGRNGRGPADSFEWCNPGGRAFGHTPTTDTGNGLIDAYLWVKGPGGSDGQCNGGPSAGIWWGDYALQMATNTGW